MTFRRRNNNFRRGARRLATKGSVRRVQNQLIGRKLRVNNDPPEFVTIPWNTVTLDTTYKFSTTENSKDIKGKTLYDILAAQFGLGVDLSSIIIFRIFTYACWETKGNGITLDCYDLIRPAALIAQFEDDAGRNHWASCGFRYPNAHSQVIISGSNNTDILCTVSSIESGEIKFRARVLWKFLYRNLPTRRTVYVVPPDDQENNDDDIDSLSKDFGNTSIGSWADQAC